MLKSLPSRTTWDNPIGYIADDMGKSYTEFQGRGFWARDSCLEVWLYLLAREARSVQNPPEWLIAAAKDWHLKATAGLNGCIHADLDKHVASSERRELALQLSRQALGWLSRQGPMVSATVLNAFEEEGGSPWSRDVDTTSFVRVGEAFMQLLQGKLKTDVRTSPVLP